MVEQRYLAVREVLDTAATVTDVALRYGVDRRTLHRWLVRYATGVVEALADQSPKPDHCPRQIDPRFEARIVMMRRAHPGWGPRTILNRLRRELDEVPSRSSIYRALVRHSLIEPTKRQRRCQDYRRWERQQAMELWQMDVMGGDLPRRWHQGVCGHRDRRSLPFLCLRQARCAGNGQARVRRPDGGAASPRSPRSDPHRQREGVHRAALPQARDGAVRSDLP